LHKVRKAKPSELRRLRAILEHQLGVSGIGEKVFPEGVLLKISRNTGKIREILAPTGEVIATVLASTYTFNLKLLAAKIIHETVPPPKLRVIIANEIAEDLVTYGNTVFAKHILYVDEDLRAGSEALVVDENDNLLCVGRLILSPDEIIHFITGPAVKLRECVK